MTGAAKNQRNSKTNQLNSSKIKLSNESNSTDSTLTTGSEPTKKSRISQNTIVSIQNFKFPEPTPNKGRIYNVKRQSDLLQFPETKSASTSKTHGCDFTSSTNSHFDHMVLTVPKKPLNICSSSVSTEAYPTKKSPSLETIKSSQLKFKKETSQELYDSHHTISKKHSKFQGAEWRLPCKESFVAGAPRKFLGTCPPNYEQISKMSKTRQKFFLTQDPRKVHCLVNPAVLCTKEFSKAKEFDALTQKVKQAHNICEAEASESSEDFICEPIDLENPLQLDFQGLDYANTFQNDEQDLENQRNYRQISRYMERRRVKSETQDNVEKELYQEMINVPKCFNVRDRNEPQKLIAPETQLKLGQLFRSADKPFNQKLINLEKEKRQERYKKLYLNKKTRQEQQMKTDEINKQKASENLPLCLANENLAKCIKDIEETIDKSAGKEVVLEKPKPEKLIFPNSLIQAKQFKNMLKQKNLIERDKARIAKEFFWERKDKHKEFPAADLEISSEVSEESGKYTKLSQLSTDDEDDLEVGKQGSKFKLRGFQYKMNSQLRGKLSQREKLQSNRKEKGCITRDEWLKELAAKRQHIALDKEMGIQKSRLPDDPKLVLFPPTFGYKAQQAEFSAIKNFIEKPLGHHYDRVRRKNLKFTKPHLRYRVKKFNLITYRFGDTAKRFSQLNENPLSDVQFANLKTTTEFMYAKALQKKRRLEEIKQKRLKLLGIPCKPFKKSHLQIKCESSSSISDLDWVPQQEPAVEDLKLMGRLNGTNKVVRSLNMRGNMPAPKHREPTLRQHPRYPRDYDNQRVPSEMFDQAVLTTNMPYMLKLEKDKVKFANVELKKTAYTEKFEARHHHDHWDPTQVKQVDVHYQPLLVKAQITTKENQVTKRDVMEHFDMSNPPCNQFVDMDLSLPQYDTKEMLANYRKNNKYKTKAKESNVKQAQNLCTQKDYKQQTKTLEALDYPGRQEYLKLLKDVRELSKESKKFDKPSKKLYVNKEEFVRELEEDLKSIESCLTSLSSSICTNLTNDSGSFLLMEGQEKIPLDYIRKSVVPFEELQRSRFQAVPIDIDKEQNNPFQVMPFAGQTKAQLELSTAKDSFFTFNTRLKNGMRLRLEVPVEDVREKLLGKGTNKYRGVVATDIDENYVKELKNRPPAKQVKFKSGQSFIKNALRLKFESLVIQGQIVRTKIYDRLNEQHWSDMQKVKVLFEKLFAKWEKREYESAMAVVYKVKKFYDETDCLKTEFKQMERDLATINMDIVFLEGHWIRCIMLQNFHYLMGDLEWRLQNDWIHRLAGTVNELENFELSITKRSTLNIRKREKDDAWAIKTFYEQEYLQNKHENLIVFTNADSFLEGLENLKTKTFIILLEMHFTFSIQTELQYKLETFEEWCARDLSEREEYVNRKCAKLYFMQDRGKWLNKRTLQFLKEPIEKCFNDELFYKDRAVITEAFRRIVPTNLRGTNGQELYTVDMVATIFEVLMDILAKFEAIPMDLNHQIEKNLRTYRTYLRKQSHQAYHIDLRIDKEMKKVVKNLEPPYQKMKRISKLPRYHLKKRIAPVPVKAKVLTERAKFLFRAFNEEELTDENVEIKDSFIHVGAEQQQIIPFYFDHFLKLNGYTPNYNFKTQIELRDGLEIDRFQIKSVIPDVQQHMEYWENLKRKIMDDNIAQNPKIYVNVMT